jgi:hypothetical protein
MDGFIQSIGLLWMRWTNPYKANRGLRLERAPQSQASADLSILSDKV